VDELEVVAFERRGRLGLGAHNGGGEKNVRLVDDLGETIKVSQDKVLHRFKARLRDGDAREIRERLRSLANELGNKAPGAVDLDLLWESLEDEKIYRVEELAKLYFGEATDAGVIALVRALGDESSGEPQYHFRPKPGGLARTDAETFGKIKARLDAERTRREREAAFRIWFDEASRAARKDGGSSAFAHPTPEQKEHLQVLADYALSGDRAPQAARARRLASDLGIADADELLVLLEKGGGLPRDVNELPHRAGVPVHFAARVRAEAEAIAAEPLVVDPAGRVDFRGKLTTAIDDVSTEDVDDGFSVWEESGELKLAIHIADVSSAIRKESELDQEAQKRATTIYFPGQTVPMLPVSLLRSRLSLDAGADRPVVSLVTTVKPGGSVGETRFVRGIARVDRRLSYDDTRDPPPEWREPLARLAPLAQALRQARITAGAIQLELPDLKVEIDEKGEPHVKLTSSDTPGHRLVSELMILYNRELALALQRARLAALFKAQPDPVPPVTIPRDDPLFPVRARRGLPPTLVEVDAGPHRTLGVPAYVQGSSPIRRFGDLLAQRQIVSAIENASPAYTKDEVRALAPEVERAEKGARRLEADRDVYWIARWFEGRREETFEGVVSRAPDGGRGLVYLPLVNQELQLGDPDSSKEYAEGTPVRVRVARCSPRRRSVTFRIVEEEAELK
jgi:exoribonuclease-2